MSFRQDWLGRGSRLITRAAAAVICIAVAQVVPALTAATDQPTRLSGMSLSPAVVMLQGIPGQGHRETLRLTNHTAAPMSFQLIAQDVIARGEERAFITAGARPDSIAATAVFSPATLTIPPGETGAVDMTLTVPKETSVRAVAAIFRGLTEVGSDGHVTMTASLGTLVTFTLSQAIELDAGEPAVVPQSGTANLRVREHVSNPGTEPVLPSGVVAILDATGQLIGRVPVEPRRLLPGERGTLEVEYPASLDAGDYQAIVSLTSGAHLLTRSVNFRVDGSSLGLPPGREPASGR